VLASGSRRHLRNRMAPSAIILDELSTAADAPRRGFGVPGARPRVDFENITRYNGTAQPGDQRRRQARALAFRLRGAIPMNIPDLPRRQVVTVLAWALVALSLVLAAAALLLLALDRSSLGAGDVEYGAESVASVVVRLAIAALGAAVISRRPENSVGWFIWAYGALALLEHFTTQYAIHTLGADPGSLPAGEVAACLQSWLWIAEFGVTGFFFFLFPDGRFSGPRWRRVAQATLLRNMLLLVGFSLKPGQLDNGPFSIGPIANPYGIESTGGVLG
jgi:hypothetical protein